MFIVTNSKRYIQGAEVTEQKINLIFFFVIFDTETFVFYQ